MPLSPNDRLGHYEVVALLGTGGMGEVYRARDRKLGREVAVKVLPKDFVADADRLARFERDARMLASLNHPNIATIHELDHVDGVHFLVLELVVGETLAERIERGPLPWEDALPLFAQIALALEAAHDKGVVHRNLKPASIKISQEGRVTVLDFGLAKSLGTAASTDPSQSPALTRNGTLQGVAMGTTPYMSPEQARGKLADKRTDIWSFGCVLYEALTGRAAFSGESVPDTNAAILGTAPDWSALPRATPARVVTLLKRCTQADPNRRLHHIADARIEVEEALHEPEVSANARKRSSFPWLVAAAAAVATALAVGLARPPDSHELLRLSIVAPEGTVFSFFESPAVSPDGTLVAFVAENHAGERLVWVRALNSHSARPLPGTEGGSFVFWSPDSRSLGFFANGALNAIDVSSGVVRRLADAEEGRGGSWSQDGVILFAPSRSSSLLRVSETGGPVERVTTLEPEQFSHRMPRFLPDGRRFLYYCTCKKQRVRVGSLDKEAPHRALDIESRVDYAPPGLLVYVRDGWLMGQRFDPDEAELQGEPVALNEGPDRNWDTGLFSVSENGVLVYGRDEALTWLGRLVWYDRSGNEIGTAGTSGIYGYPTLSPDDTKVAFQWAETADDAMFDILVLDLADNTIEQLTTGDQNDWLPNWSPDGNRVLFSSTAFPELGRAGLYQRAIHNGGDAELVIPSASNSIEGTGVASDWTDRYIVYFRQDRAEQHRDWDIWVLPLNGDRTPRRIVRTDAHDFWGRVSPDGQWMAYVSTVDGGAPEVFLRRFPDDTEGKRISEKGGSQPRWRRDGKELFFRTSDGDIYSVDVELGRDVEVSKPRLLLRTKPDSRVSVAGYDVTSDGRRFIVSEPVEPAAVRELHVVLNWERLLRR